MDGAGEDVNERLKFLRRDMRDLEEQMEQLRKKKADNVDVEQIVQKVSALELEVRSKHQSQSAEANELREVLRRMETKLDSFHTELSHHKRDVEDITTNAKGSVWERIPKWAVLLMGVGILALAQQGPDLWARATSFKP